MVSYGSISWHTLSTRKPYIRRTHLALVTTISEVVWLCLDKYDKCLCINIVVLFSLRRVCFCGDY